MSLLPTPILGAESLSPPPDVGGALLAPEEGPELGASPPEDEGWAEESKRRKEVVSRLYKQNRIVFGRARKLKYPSFTQIVELCVFLSLHNKFGRRPAWQ